MSLQGYLRQVKPRLTESHVNHVDRIQSLLYEAKGLDISILQNTLPGQDMLRGQVLVDAIKNKTPLQTTKGLVVLNWLSDLDRISAESGDWTTSFELGKLSVSKAGPPAAATITSSISKAACLKLSWTF